MKASSMQGRQRPEPTPLPSGAAPPQPQLQLPQPPSAVRPHLTFFQKHKRINRIVGMFLPSGRRPPPAAVPTVPSAVQPAVPAPTRAPSTSHAKPYLGQHAVESALGRAKQEQPSRLGPAGRVVTARQLGMGTGARSEFKSAFTEAYLKDGHSARYTAEMMAKAEAHIGSELRLAAAAQGWRDDGDWVPGQGPLLVKANSSMRIVKVEERPGLAGVYGSIAVAHQRDGGRIAVKIALPLPGRQEALDHELNAYRHLYKQRGRHRNVLDVYGMSYLPGGRRGMLMDNISGPNGEDGMASLHLSWQRGIISRVEFLHAMQFIARRLLAAARHLEGAGIVHADVKPENFLFDLQRGGEPILVDLGLARPTGGKGPCTPAFASPEQTASGAAPLDGRSDAFSVVASILSGAEGYRYGTVADPDASAGHRLANAGLSVIPPGTKAGARAGGKYARGLRVGQSPSPADGEPGVVRTAYTDFMSGGLERNQGLRKTIAEVLEMPFLKDPMMQDDEDGTAAKGVILKSFEYTSGLAGGRPKIADAQQRFVGEKLYADQSAVFLANPSLPAYIELFDIAHRSGHKAELRAFLADSARWLPQLLADTRIRAAELQMPDGWPDRAGGVLVDFPLPPVVAGDAELRRKYFPAPPVAAGAGVVAPAEQPSPAGEARRWRDYRAKINPIFPYSEDELGRRASAIEALIYQLGQWSIRDDGTPSGGAGRVDELLSAEDLASLQRTAELARSIEQRDAAFAERGAAPGLDGGEWERRAEALGEGLQRRTVLFPESLPAPRPSWPDAVRSRAGAGQPARLAGRPGGAGS